MILPIKIYRNNEFFANLQWLLYKYLHIKRTIPCGRTKRDSYLCCELYATRENSLIINEGDTHEIRCKVCGSCHMGSSQYINADDFESIWSEW